MQLDYHRPMRSFTSDLLKQSVSACNPSSVTLFELMAFVRMQDVPSAAEPEVEPPEFARNDDELSDARWFHRDWLRNAHIDGERCPLLSTRGATNGSHRKRHYQPSEPYPGSRGTSAVAEL